MNSLQANLFIATRDLIAGLADADENNYFRLVDQDYGQLESHSGDNRPPVSWPCVLIDLDNITYTSVGDNVQSGVATIIFRLGFPPFSSSSSITPADYSNKALYYYDLEQVLHLALQGTAPALLVPAEDPEDPAVDILEDIFGHFNRTSAVTEKREDLIRVRAITYTIAFEDYSTKDQTTFHPAAIILNHPLDIITPE